jgi:hypothetical protein
MFFAFTEEHEMIRKLTREFAQKEIAPTVEERDEEERFDRGLYDAIGEMGFSGIYFPEEYGGAGSDYVSYTIITEELARVDASLCVALGGTSSLCAWPIYAYGTETQKQKYVRPLVEGSHMGAFALTEPNAGSDASAQQTTAVLQGDHYILNGSKIFISNASQAETYVVVAVTDRSKGLKGISAFIVEKATPGFTFGKKEHKMGIRSSITMECIFQDVKIPKENLLGKEGEGFKIAMSTLDGGRIGVAATSLGIAQAALDHAIQYAKERVQFGKPLAANQGLSWMIADMTTKVEAARLLTYYAASLKDAGKPFGKEAAMAKLYASDIAMEVTTDAVQIFGGYGYSREYPVERLMRAAKIQQIFEGTNQIMKMVIAGSVLR